MTRSVESVLNQEFLAEDFEVIVVNDSGHQLSEGAWQTSERVQILETQRRERSVARNAGAAIAKGKYLHFLDDDDWLEPGALRSLWETSRNSSAKWLYGITQIVDRQDHPIVELRHGFNGNCLIQTLAGEWIPLQASLIDAETFFAVGGFDQTITVGEDVDLLRRVACVGEFSETPKVVANVAMGRGQSTTDYEKHPSVTRRARENLLNGQGVFAGMTRSAAGSSFWLGKLCRVYLTSTLWNLGHKRLSTACGRFTMALVALASANLGILQPDFWRAVARSYQSPSYRWRIEARAKIESESDSAPACTS